MAFIAFKPYGVNYDIQPVDVDDKQWTAVNNIRFNNKAAHKTLGTTQLTIPASDPLKLQFSGKHNDVYWFYMTRDGIRRTTFITDINLDTGGLVIPDGNWDSTLFNHYGIFNNELQVPLWSNGLLQVQALTGFPSDTVCKAIRPFKAFLVALNTTKAGTEQPNKVLWSDVADAGAIPQSWDVTDPSTLAGEVFLTESKGNIIDGLALRDFFVIYKTHSIVMMNFTGGQSVMGFQEVLRETGLLAKDCVAEYNGMHIILTDNDIEVFDGQVATSIADNIVKNKIFGDMEEKYAENCYVRSYVQKKEVWVCYPTTGNTYPNKAAIYHWIDKTWTFIDIGEARDIVGGVTDFKSSPTYDSQAGVSYDSQSGIPFDAPSESPTSDSFTRAAPLSIDVMDSSTLFNDAAIPTLLEKATFDFGSPERVKLVRKIIPHITGTPGTTILIRIGVQMNISDTITWLPEQAYIIGSTSEISTIGKGKYISIRFRSDTTTAQFTVHSYRVSIDNAGRF